MIRRVGDMEGEVEEGQVKGKNSHKFEEERQNGGIRSRMEEREDVKEEGDTWERTHGKFSLNGS